MVGNFLARRTMCTLAEPNTLCVYSTWKWRCLEYHCFLLGWPSFRSELLVLGGGVRLAVSLRRTTLRRRRGPDTCTWSWASATGECTRHAHVCWFQVCTCFVCFCATNSNHRKTKGISHNTGTEIRQWKTFQWVSSPVVHTSCVSFCPRSGVKSTWFRMIY